MTDATVTIRRGDRLYGPYTATQIQELIDTGSIVHNDDAWSETAGRWTKLSEIITVTPSADSPLAEKPTIALNSPEAADPSRQDRAANILAVVGLVAIALGTLDIALNMMRMEKASSQTQRSRDASHSGNEADKAGAGSTLSR
jgi:hypothetical protein